MKIIISGYGKMGKMVERVCLERNHQILTKLDTEKDWASLKNEEVNRAVVIDFSMPAEAVSNIYRCFDLGIPIVTGTTGWYEQLAAVRKVCDEKQGALFYAPNFSMGVNIFFHVNAILAKIMAKTETYRPEITEIHHVHKLDAPSGTALRLADDILMAYPNLQQWVNHETTDLNKLQIISERRGEVPGIHQIVYDSKVDSISLIHEAKSRKGFALGAVLAAEFLQGKKGIFTMRDYLKTIGL